MSRHRSPAGRHPRSAPQTAPGAWPRRADAPAAPEAAGPAGAVGVLDHPTGAPGASASLPGESALQAGGSADRPGESADHDPGFAAYATEWADRLGASADRSAGGRGRAAADRAPAPAGPVTVPAGPVTVPAGPGTARPRVGPRHAAPAVRNGLMAAAATAGLLSVTVPLVPVLPATPGDDTAALALTSEDRTAAEGPATGDELVDGRLLAASVLPVLAPADALPPGAAAASLLKAAGLADVARAEEEQRLAREAAASCDVALRGLGTVQDFVRDAARFISCLYDQPTLIGVAGRARVSDHPRGLAIDFMTERERGDLLADCALANQQALGINYVMWRQRVNYGDGWEPMADRGSPTENHMDHVHVSFEPGGGSGDPLAALCT